ncbi:MAG: HAMP domain-containing sensor histidine kinase [Chloroflexota bacterium]
MLTGIRGRLLLSYLLLLIVTLTIMAVALILFLRSRPANSDEEIHRMLASYAVRGLQDRQLIRALRSGNTAAMDVAVDRLPDDDIVIILIESETNVVYWASDDMHTPGNVIELDREEVFRGALTREEDSRPQILESARLTTRGSFEEDGVQWLFIKVPIVARPLRGQPSQSLLLVHQRPSTPLLEAVSQFGDNLSIAIIQAGLVGMGVAVILAIVITRTIGKPLQAVSDAAGAVAEGDYSHHVPVAGPLEIREVAEAFNRMSEQVELNNQAQKDLLANVSHDLKTPLTSIQGYSQAIMDGTAPDKAAAAKIIHDEAGRLTRLVGQLTELARLRSGRLSMRQDYLDMGMIVEGISQRLAVVAEKKNIALSTEINAVPKIKGDGDRMAQVVTNLLSNAIKYTPEGGEVIAYVEAIDGGVSVAVKDTGIGIAEEDISRVFERFYQVDKSRGGPRRGHGLGLAITHEIVEAHRGRIIVESAGFNQGSMFTVWLPMAQ